jgi:transposase-like protein
MGRAVAVRSDYTAGEVRRLAKRAKDAAQARRLPAIAAVLEGASRTEAAKIGGIDRQTLRDWVIRFNDQGPDGLINIPCCTRVVADVPELHDNIAALRLHC